jgi:hypothetical protein
MSLYAKCRTCGTTREPTTTTIHAAQAKLYETCAAEKALGIKRPQRCDIVVANTPRPAAPQTNVGAAHENRL